MNLQNKNDNAANRKSYVGKIYNMGEKIEKDNILKEINPSWARLHNEGFIHIHDLDAYGLTYNCLTFDILKAFPYESFKNKNDCEVIISVFDYIKELVCSVGNEQSGGMSFANFDSDFAEIFQKLNVNIEDNKDVFKASIKSLIIYFNSLHTRMGQTSYYVTLNVGLGTSCSSRFITQSLLDSFLELGERVIKPNIVFKVKKGVNEKLGDKNYDLLLKALNCTSHKMIPTYLLCDCQMDKDTDPYKLSIMGCRTRVVDNVNGEDGAIGRSNIDNITINLPRLAFMVNEKKYKTINEKLISFYNMWDKIAEDVSDILLDRFNKTALSDITLFPTLMKNPLTRVNIKEKGMKEQIKQGTLSIGYIGLSEAFEILYGEKFYSSKENQEKALEIVRHMRRFCDEKTKKYHLNFSLLATSGELISGRFCKLDSKYNSSLTSKGYYTNSFHVDVDSGISAFEKLNIEGPFHTLSNGGSISYVEIKEAPIGNTEGLYELLMIAENSGVHYLGFNFPLDICNSCNNTGLFDICPVCKSKSITRIRRVSGYLENQSFFTDGKMKESLNRKAN